jgi:hypothetical protein
MEGSKPTSKVPTHWQEGRWIPGIQAGSRRWKFRSGHPKNGRGRKTTTTTIGALNADIDRLSVTPASPPLTHGDRQNLRSLFASLIESNSACDSNVAEFRGPEFRSLPCWRRSCYSILPALFALTCRRQSFSARLTTPLATFLPQAP